MNKIYSICITALLIFVSRPAFAQLNIEDGIWNDPTQSGSGFVIELQDNIMAVAAFTYDASGRATWFLSTGLYANQKFSSSLTLFAGGQCLGCSYVPASVSSSPGTVTIDFSGTNRGVLSFNGVPRYTIRRNYYAFPTVDDLVLGGWAATFRVPGSTAVAGAYPALRQKVTFTDGTPGVAGTVGGSNRPVSGYYNPVTAEYFLLADISNDFWLAYFFKGVGKDTWLGDSYLYRKNQSAFDVPAVLFYGARIASRSQIQTQSKGAEIEDAQVADITDWQSVSSLIAAASNADARHLDAGQVAVFEKLAHAIEVRGFVKREE